MTVSKKTRTSSRKLRKHVRRLSDLYGEGVSGNLLQGRYGTEKVYAWFQQRHRRGRSLLDNGVYRSGNREWRVPPTVLACVELPLSNNQMSNRLAWYVTWISPRTGQRLKKYFMSPWVAMEFIATKAVRVDPHAALVSRTRPYYIVPKYRGKLPHKDAQGRTWYWCPLCMQPRRFRSVQPPQEFYAMVKKWSDEKARYIWADRKLRLLECSYCSCTNRDSTFRRSNQPWEVRKFRKGTRRAKRRRR